MGSNPGWGMLKPEQTEPFIASRQYIYITRSNYKCGCYKKIKPFKYETNNADTEKHQLSSLFIIRYTIIIIDLISLNLQFIIEKALYGVKTADFREPVTLVNFKMLFYKRMQLRMFCDIYSDYIITLLLDKEHFRCFIRIFEDLCEDLDNRLEALVRCDEITWEFLLELFLPKTKGTCLECEETIDKEGGDCSIFIPEFESKVAIRSLEVYPKDFMED
ncbi:hypothetical protein QL093DRAFT_2570366 [Fusarium oxysporum]|nr:hypothetical protein QL093DRAFT_2570366 [Fusarium oxysporum]